MFNKIPVLSLGGHTVGANSFINFSITITL